MRIALYKQNWDYVLAPPSPPLGQLLNPSPSLCFIYFKMKVTKLLGFGEGKEDKAGRGLSKMSVT